MAHDLKSFEADPLAREGSEGTVSQETAGEECRRRVEELFARARARMKAEGIKPPTAEEIDEIIGYNEFGIFD